MRLQRTGLLVVAASLLMLGPVGAQQPPIRDTPAQQQELSSTSNGRISGRVTAADTGRPISRARVMIRAPEVRGGRGVLTDENGIFDMSGLPAGRYSVTASKLGFVDLSYGQRRPLLPGTPLQLGDDEHLTGIQFRLPRGSVVSGHVYDETGEPLPGSTVRVLRYEYAQGNRRLVPAGTGQSDDRGMYRVWGLNPGQYYISAVARNLQLGRRRGQLGARGAGPIAGRGGLRGLVLAPDEPAPEDSAYAPTYYPGVNSPSDAEAIDVGLSAEVLGVNVTLRLVPTATVSGRVVAPAGVSLSRASVILTPDAPIGRGAAGANHGGRIPGDGAFTIRSVPPGRYILRVRANGEPPFYAEQPITVDGMDVPDVTVVLGPGAAVSGMASFEALETFQLPNTRQVRISAPSFDGDPLAPNPNVRPESDGSFHLQGVPPGSHWIRAQAPNGWMLKQVVIAGRDVTDQPFELRGGEVLSDVQLVFSDRGARITGTVTEPGGTPVSDYTVLVFPTDAGLWRQQARQIATARPDQNGHFDIANLPSGEYYVAIADPTEPGEWYDPRYLQRHRVGAETLLLGEGDAKTLSLRVPGL